MVLPSMECAGSRAGRGAGPDAVGGAPPLSAAPSSSPGPLSECDPPADAVGGELPSEGGSFAFFAFFAFLAFLSFLSFLSFFAFLDLSGLSLLGSCGFTGASAPLPSPRTGDAASDSLASHILTLRECLPAPLACTLAFSSMPPSPPPAARRGGDSIPTRDCRFCAGSRNCAKPSSCAAAALAALASWAFCFARIRRLTAPVMRRIVPHRDGPVLRGSATTSNPPPSPASHSALRARAGAGVGGAADTTRSVACDKADFHRRAATLRPPRPGCASLTPRGAGPAAEAGAAAGLGSAGGAPRRVPRAARWLRFRGAGRAALGRRLCAAASRSALSRSGRVSAGARASSGTRAPSRSRAPRKKRWMRRSGWPISRAICRANASAREEVGSSMYAKAGCTPRSPRRSRTAVSTSAAGGTRRRPLLSEVRRVQRKPTRRRREASSALGSSATKMPSPVTRFPGRTPASYTSAAVYRLWHRKAGNQALSGSPRWAVGGGCSDCPATSRAFASSGVATKPGCCGRSGRGGVAGGGLICPVAARRVRGQRHQTQSRLHPPTRRQAYLASRIRRQCVTVTRTRRLPRLLVLR